MTTDSPAPPRPAPRRIAVVGSGISGLASAWLLSQHHEVTLFEAAPRIGGHSNTVSVTDADGGQVPVDTGFIVYNDATYPNLHALFTHLGVVTQPTTMSFAICLAEGNLEYSGSGLGQWLGFEEWPEDGRKPWQFVSFPESDEDSHFWSDSGVGHGFGDGYDMFDKR